MSNGFDLVICAVGDTLINHDDPLAGFAASAPILEQADIVFANCEGIYVREPSPMLLASDAKNASGLTIGNVSVMSLANNHVMDAGPAGLASTIEILDEHGIRTVGAGVDLDAARAPVVLEPKGVRTAFVAAASTFPAGIEAKRGRPGINPLRFHNHYYLAEGDLEFNPGVMPEVMVIPWPQDIDAMKRAIGAAKEVADVVVFTVHWGEPVRPVTVQDFERDTTRLAIDAGADLVLCHHHHIVRGVAWYRGAPIFHGLGNFVFHTQGFGAIPPNVKRILEKQGGEYAPAFYEDYPLFPMHPESRITFIGVCGVRNGAVERCGAIPAIVRPDGSVDPLHLDSDEGRSVADYLIRSNAAAELGTEMRIDGGLELGGYRALDIVPRADSGAPT
jgi:poly-gamma-glutamate synthesis protein (capsule biosynthesis protein)